LNQELDEFQTLGVCLAAWRRGGDCTQREAGGSLPVGVGATATKNLINS